MAPPSGEARLIRTLFATAALLALAARDVHATDLTFWAPAMYSPSSGFAEGAEIHKKLYAKFEAENPDIKLHYEVIASGPPGLQHYVTAASSHNLPDAGIVDGEWVARLVLAKVLQPLDELWPKQDQADYHPDVIKDETIGGKPYAIMFQTGMRGLVYRPSTLKSTGFAASPLRPRA
jgi:ABC-type glycerol-3-phosphate transport system substrate-binding protein